MSTRTALLGAASLLALAVSVGPALADGMPSRGRIAGEGPRTCATSANVGATTDYVFRGISQSNEEGAVQGGVDFSCGNFYLGVWGSSVAFANGSEFDVYGGYKTNFGRFAVDLGLIYYAYPGNDSDLDYLELKAAVSTELRKGTTIGGAVYYSPEYTFDTGPVTTVEGTISHALPRFSIFSPTLSATVGRSIFSDEFYGNDLSYNYWNAGVTLGFYEKWSLDIRYWDTDGEGFASNWFSGPLGDDRIVGTVKYSF